MMNMIMMMMMIIIIISSSSSSCIKLSLLIWMNLYISHSQLGTILVGASLTFFQPTNR
jgi:hypothetical protein